MRTKLASAPETAVAVAELVEVKASGAFTCRFLTWGGPDLDGDVQVRGNITNLSAEVPVSAWGHSSWTATLPVGRATLRDDAKGALAVGRFFDTQGGREHLEVVRAAGRKQEWSYGFAVLERDGKRIVRQRVDEVSPVLRGAGLDTELVSVDGADAKTADLDPELLAACRGHLADHKRYEAEQDAEIRRIYETFQQYRLSSEMNEEFARFQMFSIKHDLNTAYRYAETSPPPARIAEAADAMVNMTASDLGIAPPKLHWIKALPYGADTYDVSTARDVWGLCLPDGICVRSDAGLTGRKLASIIAHEVKHAAGGDEPEAQAYERDWFERLAVVDGRPLMTPGGNRNVSVC